MTLELADRSITQPIGIAEDVDVKVGKFQFLADFVVVDFDSDPRVPLILRISFLKTGCAFIDVYEGELTLRVGKEAVTFNLDQTSRYSSNYDDMMVNRIDVIEMDCKEYSQEVCGFSDVIASGNPTPYYDLIISTSSPTLTPFGDSDFLLEEVDAFLALEDDPTSLEVDDSYYDPEGDILLLESFLNDDPSLPPPTEGNYLPEIRKELKVCEAKTDKSSIDEPPEVELKDLPPHLEYAFLEGDDKLPVIIAKDLSVEEKAALIKVLKSHKRAIAWKLSDIKEYQDTANSVGKKETKAMVFHKMDTEEVSDRFVAPCFVNGLEAYDGEINIGVEENMISNEYAFIINPKEDDVEHGVIFRRSFLRMTKAITDFGVGTITIYPDIDPFLEDTEEEEKSMDDWDQLLDFNLDDIPLLGGEEIPPFEEAAKEALTLRISKKFALLEEVRPVLETMAYHDKYKKVLDEIWKDKVELDRMIVNENALADTRYGYSKNRKKTVKTGQTRTRERKECTRAEDLIARKGRVIPEDPQPGVPRVGIPRPLRASMQDLYDRMGAYNPPGYAQPQYDQYYQQYPPPPPQYPSQYQQQQQDDDE
ncbi:reverse transcriptase domain-containing protein [Tanacetum coccineum]